MKSFEQAQETYVPEKVNRRDERKMQWFRDAKFGMFIHWGLYSMLEKGEAIQ
ncbi:MAG: alpha-L-fucosidase [Eisenbergiella sp.]